jgi:RNA polymerase sigma-70 factor (ECF subfamily)
VQEDRTDEELLVACIDDRAVFGVLVERYEEKLRRYLRRLMPGLGDECDDVLQEVFLKVYVNARGFDSKLSFSSWVYRIAHNEAVSWLRKKKSRPESTELAEDDYELFVHNAELANDFSEARLARDAVSRVLADMSEKYRTVLVLRFMEGKSYEEISDVLTVPGGTVATLVHRAKKEFSSKYTDHE